MGGRAWPPDVLAGRYVLGDLLGRGGMGGVWRAEDRTLKRTVAVKLIQLAAQADETAQARFTREAQAAAGLTHPNVVTVHDFGIDEGIAYMVMEFLPGPDLSTLVSAHGALPVEHAVGYLEQAASGLAAAHQRGILHRDVKPANLMLTDSGTLKVVDFGIAAIADSPLDLTATGNVIGTLAYLAPELSTGSPASVQSDLYALGCVAVALLTGRPPFEGATGQLILQHLNEAPPRLAARRPGLPDELDRLVAGLLAKDPARRPRTADEVVAQLRRIRTWRGPAGAGPAASTVQLDDREDATVLASRPTAGFPRGAATDPAPVAAGAPATVVAGASRQVGAGLPPGYADAGVPEPPSLRPAPSAGRRWPWLLAAVLAAVVVLIVGAVALRGMAAQGITAADPPSPSQASRDATSSPVGAPASAVSARPSESTDGAGDSGSGQSLRVVARYRGVPKAVGIAVDADRGRLYVASYGEGSLIALDAATGERVADVPVGHGTAGLAFDEALGVAHLQNVNGRTVTTVDVSDFSQLGTVTAGDGKGRIAVDSSSHRVFAVNEARQAIQVLDSDTSKIVGEIRLDVTPRSLVFDQTTNRLYVVSAAAGVVLVVDPDTLSVVGRASVGDAPVSVAVDAGHGELLVVLEASSEVAVLELESLQEVARVPVGSGALGIAVDAGRRLAYVANTKDDSLSVVDLAARVTRSTVQGVGDGPQMVAVDPSSHRVYVTSWYSGSVTVLK